MNAKNLALVLVLAAAACSKSSSNDQAKPAGATVVEKSTSKDPGTPGAAKAEPAAEAPKPEAPTSTGVLDLELQKVGTSYKLLSPRVEVTMTSRPQVSREDMPAPDGTQIPAAMAMASSGNRFDGLVYIPIPKDVTYDVDKGLKGARDGMLKMFEGKYDAKDEKTKLGPFDAIHVSADGSRQGQAFHVEAWIAWDDTARTVYGLMAVRMPNDATGGLAELHDGFKLREGADAAKAGDKK